MKCKSGKRQQEEKHEKKVKCEWLENWWKKKISRRKLTMSKTRQMRRTMEEYKRGITVAAEKLLGRK